MPCERNYNASRLVSQAPHHMTLQHGQECHTLTQVLSQAALQAAQAAQAVQRQPMRALVPHKAPNRRISNKRRIPNSLPTRSHTLLLNSKRLTAGKSSETTEDFGKVPGCFPSITTILVRIISYVLNLQRTRQNSSAVVLVVTCALPKSACKQSSRFTSLFIEVTSSIRHLKDMGTKSRS